MTRTVSVKLKADVAEFIPPVDASTHATEKLDDKVDELDRSINKITPDALKAGAGLSEMGDSAEKASSKTEKLRDSSGRFVKAGTEMAETAHRAKESVDDLKDKVDELDDALDKIPADAAKAGAAMKLLSGDVKDIGTNFAAVGDKSSAMTILDTRIKNTRSEVKKLGEEFVKTGDVDVFRKLGKASGDLNLLTDFRKGLANSVEKGLKDGVTQGGPQAANTFSQLFQGGIIKALSNPYVAGAAAALAFMIGPLIGSAIGGAIIAAGAVGAVALGVAGAVQADPKAIGDAWSAQIGKIKTEWIDASIAFVKPTVQAIHTIGGAVRDLHIAEILGKAAEFVAPLAQGVAGFISGIGRGIEALVNGAGPVIQMLKAELPALGDSIATSLSLIAGGSGGAAQGLRDILQFTEKVIIGIGVAIRLTEDLYSAFKRAGEAVRSVTDSLVVTKAITDFLSPKPAEAFAVSLDGAAHGLDKTKDAAAAAEPTLDQLSQTLSKTTATVDSLAASMVRKLFTATMGLQQANLSFNESLLNVSDSLKENGRSLDSHTRKGIANQRSILSSVSANMELYQAQIAAGGSATDAAHDYDVNTAALERQLRKAGLTQGAIDGLIGKYRKVPANVNTTIAIQGLTVAIQQLDETLRLINGLHSRTVTIAVNHVTHYSSSGLPGRLGQAPQRLGGIVHAATGMIVPPRDPGSVLFGEPSTGGEAFIPLKGISQSRAMGLAQTVGNNYGFDVATHGSRRSIGVTIAFGDNVDSAFATAFMKLVRIGQIQVGSN